MTLEDSLKVERKAWKQEGFEEGLTEGHTEASFEAVEKIAAAGVLDEAKACEVLGVSLEGYEKFKAEQRPAD